VGIARTAGDAEPRARRWRIATESAIMAAVAFAPGSPVIVPPRRPVHLQLRRLRDPTDPCLALDAGLSDDERDRAARFRRSQDAAAFRLARTLVRRRLGAILGLAPRDVPLVIDASGRPRCAAASPSFSITHCAGLVVVGWAAGAPALGRSARGAAPLVEGEPDRVGVDAEPMGSTIDASTGAGFLDATELREIGALAGALRSHARLERFVAKEALLKARGTGFITDPTTLRLARVGAPGTPPRRCVRFRASDAAPGLPATVDVVVLAGRWLLGVCSGDATPS
jgi:phosphopantetheinyl transferase